MSDFLMEFPHLMRHKDEKIARLTAERDEARTQRNFFQGAAEVVARERDEARAEVTRLLDVLSTALCERNEALARLAALEGRDG